jgi:hypothetical protein
MTAEERKRLKKKLKKKKQQARKKNERRKRRGKPRNVRKSTSPSDRDKEKATIAAEEMMMERDSLPMALKKEKDTDHAIGVVDAHADAKGTDREVASSSSKAQIPANVSSTSLGASVSTYSQFVDDMDDVDDNDDDADDDVGYASLERDFQRGEIQLGVKSSAGRSAELVTDCQSFACWQRPTLFTFMNFTSEVPDPSPKSGAGTGSAASSLAKLTPLKRESCKLPVGRDYARISLVRSILT